MQEQRRAKRRKAQRRAERNDAQSATTRRAQRCAERNDAQSAATRKAQRRAERRDAHLERVVHPSGCVGNRAAPFHYSEFIADRALRPWCGFYITSRLRNQAVIDMSTDHLT